MPPVPSVSGNRELPFPATAPGMLIEPLQRRLPPPEPVAIREHHLGLREAVRLPIHLGHSLMGDTQGLTALATGDEIGRTHGSSVGLCVRGFPGPEGPSPVPVDPGGTGRSTGLGAP